ncbi:MAG: tryptophan 7-halogenase [Novosphingobium sp.]
MHLVRSGLIRLIRLFPDLEFDAGNIDEFNHQTDFEYERIRDFIILHYKATERDDTPFWNYCRTMEVPDTLRRKMDLWMANGRIFREDEELFSEESWIQVFIGQGMIPHGYDPQVNLKSDTQLTQYLSNIAAVIGKCVKVMPTHAEYVAKTCPADA